MTIRQRCLPLVILCIALLLPLASVAAQATRESTQQTQVILLGTGTPFPDPDASGPATAVVVGKRVFLFDAGAGVMRRINAAGLPISGPEATFITHLHSDHTLGYADLILTSWIMRRVTPLQVYGPHGLRAMTAHLLAAYAQDIHVRTYGLEREIPGAYRVKIHEIKPGLVYKRDGVRITAVPVPHGSWKEAYAFRIDTPDRSIVISGDTRPSAALERASRGVDVLVHEVYSPSQVAPEKRPGGEFWPQYMREFHTSDIELGALASRAKPKLLVLTHIIRFGSTSESDLLAGIRAGGFSGEVRVGKDLERY